MPTQSVLLKPGVDLQQTPALNEAGISQSQMVRTKNGLLQTMGGWLPFGIGTIPSTVRSLHSWQDIDATDWLSAGATQNLVALTETSYLDITPQTRISSAAPNVSISSGSNIVTIVDVNAGLTANDAVAFQTPISIGNILLQGAYQIQTAPSTGSFTIFSNVIASTTIASSGKLPQFVATSGSNLVTVLESNHPALAITGIQQTFLVNTAVAGITIGGKYNVYSVTDSSQYAIVSQTVPSTTATVTMNASVAQYLYYVTAAPLMGPLGYGGGAYGAGAYGSGTTGAGDVGNPITATDWSQDNWGEILLAVPTDGPVFQWAPDRGLLNAQIVPQAPLLNGGCFVSMPQQILVLWKSVQFSGTQDNLIVRWSDAQDFTNWTVAPDSAAGSFHIPTGSVIKGGLQAPNFGVIWTDVDVWIMQFIGAPGIFNFTQAGSGCGLIGQHAAGVIAGDIYWCSGNNFFVLSSSGVQILPCTVWDFIFQNLSRTHRSKVVCAPNSAFNEAAWFFPSSGATECDSYVKYNIVDRAWDYGTLTRTAWLDAGVLGPPTGVDNGAQIYQHERGNKIDGTGNSFFRTGWWTISDGEDLAFVDFVMPDFQWGTYGNPNSAIQLMFYSVDYPGDTPKSYGPYTVTQANQYITPRIRGRLMSMQAISASNDEFWRIGRIRFRWGQAGRR